MEMTVSLPEPSVGNYFVSAYPPFSCWSPATVPILSPVLRQSATRDPIGIYIHIPFCEKKCDFCYYQSYVGARCADMKVYLENVAQELALYRQYPVLQDRRVGFVYFGGGTPSILTPELIRFVGSQLQAVHSWDQVEEITFEVAPRTVSRDRLEAMRALGVTRISMGVQSFDDTLLRLNGRIHLSADVSDAYGLIQAFAFDWVNLDLT